ncbi:MAG: TonB family protein [bacterium]
MDSGTGGYRSTVSALVSAILHVTLLFVLATTSIQLVSHEEPRIIPLVIRDPAPPPPPGAAPADAVVGSAAPPAAVKLQPQPIPAQIVQPQPDKPKIAAKPKPPVAIARAQPTPHAAPAPVSDTAQQPADNAAPAGASGVIGGVAGGQAGGKVGGRFAASGDDLFTLDQVAVAPKLIDKVVPVYPALARARSQEGAVKVRAIIARSGDVEGDSVRVVDSVPPFDTPAIDAVKHWRYSPGRDEAGTAVRVLLTVSVRFQLRGD